MKARFHLPCSLRILNIVFLTGFLICSQASAAPPRPSNQGRVIQLAYGKAFECAPVLKGGKWLARGRFSLGEMQIWSENARVQHEKLGDREIRIESFKQFPQRDGAERLCAAIRNKVERSGMLSRIGSDRSENNFGYTVTTDYGANDLRVGLEKGNTLRMIRLDQVGISHTVVYTYTCLDPFLFSDCRSLSSDENLTRSKRRSGKSVTTY